MCGRYGMFSTLAEIVQKFGLMEVSGFELRPHYNASPSQLLPVIIEEQERELKLMQWGLIPHWATNTSFQYKTINAMAETVSSKPTFRDAFKSKHCIIPVNGFYEWIKVGKEKIPMYFTLKSESLFAFAGLWETWKNPLGKIVESYTIITTEANKIVAPIHNRMPVILGENYNEWLSKRHDKDYYLSLLKPYPANEMNVWQVSKLVNKSSYDSKELIEKIDIPHKVGL